MPSAMDLARALYFKDAPKILSLRWDALAWMLSCADLRSGSHPLVVDGCGGLLIGAVTERVGQEAASITGLYESAGAPNHYLGFFNFSAPTLARLKMSRLDEYLRALPEAPAALQPRNHSLVMAVGHEPTLLVQKLWPLLADGGCFVCYSEYVEAFNGVINWIKKAHAAVDYRINEIFFREYQVLPGRSHPQMQMNNASGFVLSLIKVNPEGSNAPAQVEAAARKMEKKDDNKNKKQQKQQQKGKGVKREREDAKKEKREDDDKGKGEEDNGNDDDDDDDEEGGQKEARASFIDD